MAELCSTEQSSAKPSSAEQSSSQPSSAQQSYTEFRIFIRPYTKWFFEMNIFLMISIGKI